MAHPSNSSPFDLALRSCRSYLTGAAVLSLAINLLYLASPLYMLQLYNRVVSSGSQMTLLLLTVILLGAFIVLGVLQAVRSRVLTRLGARLENHVAGRLLGLAMSSPDTRAAAGAVRDFDVVRQFMSGGTLQPVFDLPWTPIFVIASFLLHPLLGLFTLGCCGVLAILTLISEVLSRNSRTEPQPANRRITDSALRHTQLVNTLGMAPALRERWREERRSALQHQLDGADRSGDMGSFIKTLRISMQSLALGLGAWLVLTHQSSAGVMFASSLLLARSLQPVEQILGSWRSLAAALAARRRLRQFFAQDNPTLNGGTRLPRPRGQLEVVNGHLSLSRAPRLLLRGLNFEIAPGAIVGVVGPSGSGKSLLAQVLVGMIPLNMGSVRIDGAAIGTWPRDLLGRYIGYLPQQIDLLEGTISENIGRFQTAVDEQVIEAAQLAGAHEQILSLPEGYDTRISEDGRELAGGLRQLISLARAVFGQPSLVVLDEPVANLDAAGERRLLDCLVALRHAGRTVVVVSPRGTLIEAIDSLLVLRDGGVQMHGGRDAVLGQLGSRQGSPSYPRASAVAGNA